MSEFYKAATLAGFSAVQAAFMEDWIAQVGHSHEINDIEGLVEELNGEGEEIEDED